MYLEIYTNYLYNCISPLNHSYSLTATGTCRHACIEINTHFLPVHWQSPPYWDRWASGWSAMDSVAQPWLPELGGSGMCSDVVSERRQPLSRSAGTVNELCNQEFIHNVVDECLQGRHEVGYYSYGKFLRVKLSPSLWFEHHWWSFVMKFGVPIWLI